MARDSIYKRLPIYYGWIIFAMTFLTFFFMYGLRYSIGVFFVPLQVEFGWTKAMTAGVVTTFFWFYAVGNLFAGRIADMIGTRKSILLGGLLLGCGGILSSLVYEIWHLYITWGVIAAIGASILYVLPNMTLTKFFLKKRGKAVGWSSIGVSLGQAVLVPFAAWLISDSGWRFAYVILGSFVLVLVSLLGYLLFRESPEAIGLTIEGGKMEPEETEQEHAKPQKNDDWTLKEAMTTRCFKLINVSNFFAIGGIISLLTFVVPHIIDLGIDPLLASTAFGMIGITSGIGSFIFGIISDAIGRKKTLILCSTGIGASMFISTFIPPNMTLLYAWVTLYGLTYGGLPEQYAAIVADYFGNKYGASLFGITCFAGALGGGLFPLIGGYMADVTGSYYASLIFLGAGMCIAVATIFGVEHPKKNSSAPTK